MRVALDARLIGLPGIGRFVAGLWGGLLEHRVDLHVFTDPKQRSWLGGHHQPAPSVGHPVRARPFFPVEQLVVPRMLRRAGVDVFHSPHLTVPYSSRVPIVLTVHDLFPLRPVSNARSALASAYYRAVLPRAVARATAIVAISSYTADELRKVLRVSADRLHVIGHGIDHARWQPQSPEAVEASSRAHGLATPYLLYVGTAKPHKNLATAIAALDDRLPSLVIVGATKAELERGGLPSHRVIALGRVPDAALPALYAGADALLLPSLYEAVGFTALEAMAVGTPVVASSGGGLPDTIGDAGLLVDPQDIAGWNKALHQVVESSGLRAELIGRGWARVQHLSWADVARRYLDVYASVGG